MSDPKTTSSSIDIAAYLDIPPERRQAHMAQTALLAKTAAQVALTLPLSADVDDFRRMLVDNAPAVAKKDARA